jgi:hypothetical protein
MYSRSREMDRAIKATFTIIKTKMTAALANKKYIALMQQQKEIRVFQKDSTSKQQS